MITIPISYSGLIPIVSKEYEAVSGQVGTLRVQFSFSGDWDSYPHRTAMFSSKTGVRPKEIPEDGIVKVPSTLIQNGVTKLRISAFGNSSDDGGVLRYNGAAIDLSITPGGMAPQDSSREATAYEKLLIRVIAVEESLGEAVEYANAAGDDARSAAAEAGEKAALANSAADDARAAEAIAKDAADKAEAAADGVEKAAQEARDAAGAANAAAQRVENAAESAEAAAKEASENAQRAGSAASSASAAAELANTAGRDASAQAEAARNAAESASGAAKDAGAAAASANAAAGEARTAAADASGAASAADTAANDANEAAKKANEAASDVAEAAENAEEKAQLAENAADKADVSAERANNAAAAAEAVAEGSVLYNARQALTEGEQGQARWNISAAGAIEETASGEVITVTDSARAPLRGLRVYGKSTQASTAGKNLFDLSKISVGDVSTTANYISEVGDDYFVITSPPDVSSNGFCNTGKTLMDVCPEMVSGETYVLSMDSQGERKSIYISGTVWYAGNKLTITDDLLSGIVVVYGYSQQEGQGTGDCKISNIQIELGETATAYEPYTGGAPSPSPDYPQKIVSTGDGGEIGAHIAGKNLFDLSKISVQDENTSNYISEVGDDYFVITSAPSASSNGYCNTKKTLMDVCPEMVSGKTYVLSMDTQGVGKYIHFQGTTWRAGTTLTITDDMLNGVVVFYGYSQQGGQGTGDCKISNIQIELGETATAYEPYKAAQSLPILTPDGLPGIPVTSGGNHTDADGQQWVCDYVDLERGVRVQRTRIDILDGSNVGWGHSANNDSNDTNLYYCFVKKFSASSNALAVLSSKLIAKNVIISTDVSGITLNVGNYEMIYVRVRKDTGITTLDEWKASLDEEPMEVMFPIDPIETPLTAEEIAAYRALYTNYPNTTVTNDAGAGMELDYTADTKLYIDKKFAELSAAVLNN